MQPAAPGAAGVGGRWREPTAEGEWKELRERVLVYRNALALAEVQKDTPRMRELCREGLSLLEAMEVFVQGAAVEVIDGEAVTRSQAAD
jgi:hypothetical protein